MGIRVVPNETVPAAVYRVLLPHERRVVTVRFHAAVLFFPTVATVGGLIAAGVLTLLGLSADALAITWSVWVLALLYWMLRVVGYLETYFVITAARLILVKGSLRTDIEMMPLSMAAQVTFQRSPLGKLLGYGRFIFADVDSGRGLRTVNFLPYPEQLYIELNGLIFPDPG